MLSFWSNLQSMKRRYADMRALVRACVDMCMCSFARVMVVVVSFYRCVHMYLRMLVCAQVWVSTGM
jgi:hypothetical protein